MTEASKKDRPLIFGWFQAKHLWPLAAFVKHARDTDPLRFIDGNIMLEPCAEGGAYLVAATGHATVIIRDPDAHVSSPVTLDIPYRAFEAARGVKLNCMIWEGQHYTPETPEWLQPGRVYVYSAGMHISPKMRHPMWSDENNFFQPALFTIGASVGAYTIGEDYRMKDGTTIKWRSLLKSTLAMSAAESSTVYFNPSIPAMFSDLVEMILDEEEARPDDEVHFPLIAHTMLKSEKSANAILRFDNRPDIIGLWAGMKPPEKPFPQYADHFLHLDDGEQGQ